MKVLILATILGLASCASLDNLYLPASQRFTNQAHHSSASYNQVPILKFSADNDGEGTYQYNYETGNSISAQEQGDARGDGTKAHGSYSYVAPDGQHISITYTADENGFVPQGSHIPTPPPIPEAILKALQENAAAEARGVFDDGQYHGEGLSEGSYKNEGHSGVETFARVKSGSYVADGGYRY